MTKLHRAKRKTNLGLKPLTMEIIKKGKKKMGKKMSQATSSTRLAPMSIKISPKLKEVIEKVAREEDRTASNYVERILRIYHEKRGLARRAPVTNCTGDRKEDEIMLGASALKGAPALAIDNIETPIGGALLCQLFSQRYIDVRILGVSKKPTAETAFLITINGNNIKFKGDITERLLKARLNAKMEEPGKRVFTWGPVVDALNNRAKLVVAVLTVLRAYKCSGERKKCIPYNDFKDWSRMIREALMWYGEPDPVLAAKEVKDEDPDKEEHWNIIYLWHQTFGKMPHTLAEVAAGVEMRNKKLYHALLTVAEKEEKGVKSICPKKLGNWLRDKHEVPRGGLIKGERRTLTLNKKKKRIAQWLVEEIT